MKSRQYLTLLFFAVCTVGLSLYSFIGNFEEQNKPSVEASKHQQGTGEESFFKVVDLYLIDHSRPFVKLEAHELILANLNNTVLGMKPSGVIYQNNDQNEEVPIFFEADKMKMEVADKHVALEGAVLIRRNVSTLNSEQANIINNGQFIEAAHSVKTKTIDQKTNDEITVDSDYAIYKTQEDYVQYMSNVRGKITRKRQYEESVTFSTDLLTLFGARGEVEMRGNVALKKDNLDAYANQGTVFLENYNKKLKYYALSDDVRLQERLILDGKPVTRKAFSEKLEGIISEKRIILTGLPKVFQEKDVIKGNRIIIRENIETVEVDDANTSITLEPEGKR